MNTAEQNNQQTDTKQEARDQVIKAIRDCHSSQATMNIRRLIGALDENSKTLGGFSPDVPKFLNDVLENLDKIDELVKLEDIFQSPKSTDAPIVPAS